MDLKSLPILDLTADPQRFADDVGASFRQFGFAMVANYGLDTALVREAWQLTEALFALPERDKVTYAEPSLAGARGYTPFATEIAKGAEYHDLKEFWHIGRDLPENHPLSASMPPNIWPASPPRFREVFTQLYAEFDRVGDILLARIALHLGLPDDWFRPATQDGNSVLRLLHYPPLSGESEALRAGAHEDINLITLLLGAEEAGLELLSKAGQWLAVSPPDGAIVVNIGDMLQRMTNHVLPSTTHRVRNPSGSRSCFSRYSMPFFVHLRSDYTIETLPSCVSAVNPDRYPEPITADAYLQERLREIGLKT